MFVTQQDIGLQYLIKMVRISYIIPISGSQEAAYLMSERTRVGNIFDTTRQAVMLYKNSVTGVSKNVIYDSITTFSSLEDSAYERNSQGTQGINMSYREISGTTYTFTATDYCVDVTSGSSAVTLPTAVSIAGRVYILKNSGTGTVPINTTSSQTIDGVASGVLTLIQLDSLTVMSNGANWIIIS